MTKCLNLKYLRAEAPSFPPRSRKHHLGLIMALACSPAGKRFIVVFLLLGLVIPVLSKNYFDKCAAEFEDGLATGNGTISSYRYTGNPRGLRPGRTPPNLITFDGCVALCGSSWKGYRWDKVSDTITTWVLPLAGGILLQLPFESNQRFATLLTICRWLGSPIASLMYILYV